MRRASAATFSQSKSSSPSLAQSSSSTDNANQVTLSPQVNKVCLVKEFQFSKIYIYSQTIARTTKAL